MPSVEELGRRIKRENPGAYDDYSDYEVGEIMKEENPNKYKEYSNSITAYIDNTPAVFSPNQLAPLLEPSLPNQQIEALKNYYRPSRGVFTSWWQQGKSEARVELLKILNEEQVLVIERGMMLEKAIREGKKSEADFRLYIAQNAYILLIIQQNAQLIEQANNEGLSLENFNTLKLGAGLSEIKVKEYKEIQSADTEKHNKTESQLAKIDRKKEKQQSKLKLKEYKEKTEIDFQRDVRLAQEQLRLEIIAGYLSSHQQISLIQDLIDEQYIKIADIKESKIIPEIAKSDMIKSRERIIAMYMKEQDETQTKALQS